jgi:hypothetical protein
MQRLRSEFGVYGVDSGRICVAALNSKNIDAVVPARSPRSLSEKADCRQAHQAGDRCESPALFGVFTRWRVTGQIPCCSLPRMLQRASVLTSTIRLLYCPHNSSRNPMLYQLYETQRALLSPFSEFASASAKLYSHPLSPFAHTPLAQRVSAGWT